MTLPATRHGEVQYGDEVIRFVVQRSERVTLDIAVSPDGTVTVIAPITTKDDDVNARVRRRAAWILRQQRYFAEFRPRTPPRIWVPGETHRYLGRQYRLRVGDPEASDARVRLTRGFLLIDGIAFTDSESIERVVRRWYRDRAHVMIDRRLPACENRFRERLAPASVAVRVMTSRWASMSPSGRLTVNPALIQAPTDSIDYVLTHELAHILVPDHSPAFWTLMDQVMPDHARRKARLERATV